MVVRLAGFHFVKQLLRVAKAGGHSNFDIHSGNRVGGLLDAFHAADIGEVQSRQLFPGQCLHCGTKGRLHNTAGSAEDDSRTGAKTERRVKFFVRQLVETDAQLLYHSCQLPGGQRVVHIRHAVGGLVVSANLELLGGTWHDTYGYDILRL